MRSPSTFEVMAQGFQACRLQRSVQGFFTELSTEVWRGAKRSLLCRKHSENHPQGPYDQIMIKPMQPLNSKGCSDMPPCFPQAAPHYPWKSTACGNNGLRGECGELRERCATSCPHLHQGQGSSLRSPGYNSVPAKVSVAHLFVYQ